MTQRQIADLLLLGALWGASFLFMRLGAADFGPVALAFIRVAGASLLLLPLLVASGARQPGAQVALWQTLRRHWRAIALVGVVSSALPFVLYTAAALALSAALMAVFNATVPIWAALLAWAWLGDRPGRNRVLGLAVGIAGVVWLCWGKADFRPGEHGISAALAIALCLAATACYGLGANVSRRYLGGVPPLVVAAGSQLVATVVMLGPALWWWPAVNPGPLAWAGAAALALLCTGWAYVLFFRLIAQAGAAQAVSVTFLIPGFAMLWGWIFLAEPPTLAMLLGCAVILLGTALSTGVLRLLR